MLLRERESALHNFLTILRIATVLQTARFVVVNSQGEPPSARGRTARSGCGDQKMCVCVCVIGFLSEGGRGRRLLSRSQPQASSIYVIGSDTFPLWKTQAGFASD